MNPEQAYTLAQYLLGQIEHESKCTHKVLSAVPETGTDYKPHDRNMTALQLAAHLAFADMWFLHSIVNGEFKTGEDAGSEGLTPSQIAAAYAEKMPALIQKARGLSGEQVAKPIRFYTWNFPAVEYLTLCLKHSIHHRGQLSAYLRPIGGKVPAIYGGSADEPVAATQQA